MPVVDSLPHTLRMLPHAAGKTRRRGFPEDFAPPNAPTRVPRRRERRRGGGARRDGFQPLSMREARRMLSVGGCFPLRAALVVAAVVAAAAAPPPPYTPRVAGLDERPQ